MKIFFQSTLCFALCAFAGCSAAVVTSNPKDEAGRTTTLGQTLTKGEGMDTTSNISQINQMLGMVKGDNEGVAPATIDEAKRAAKVPETMWIDKATGKPLVYDPASGTVSR